MEKQPNIQDYLAKHGYAFNHVEQVFEKWPAKISVEEIIGHTVDSFAAKARAKGWVAEAAT